MSDPPRRRSPTLKIVPGQSPDGSTKAPLLSVVIPVYNEEGIISSSVIALRENLRDLGYSFEILLAENGSRDRTVELAQELCARYTEVEYFSIGEPNYGRALKEGILRARGTFVVCDEIDLGDIDFYQRALERLIDGDAAMVVGSKTLPGAEDTRPMFRHVATMVYNGMLRVLLHFHGTDTHGMKAFRRDALVGTAGRCVVDKDVFASEFVIRAERERHPVVEIPVRVVEKRAPSINLTRRVPNVLRNLAQLTYVLRRVD
ncbi:MAG: glycosyltransferase family 2 protein [Deltaproteobacteria bacterium]|nr:glycosyltransferase family 2 protein [Deltaproteobacteria bacterium]